MIIGLARGGYGNPTERMDHPLLFEGGLVGGLLRNANLVENYPGFPRGISGTRLVNLFIRQAKNLNIRVMHEEVLELDYKDDLFQARTAHDSYCSHMVVIATGTKPCGLGNITIPEELSKLVFYEVYNLLHLQNKNIVIIGSGDAAFDYALNLSRKNRVIILNRGENFKCLPLLWERAQRVSLITYKNNSEVYRLSTHSEAGMLVDCHSRAGELQFHADYLVGDTSRLDFI
jgi:thioredoxin reductase